MSTVFLGGSRKLSRLNSAIRTRLGGLITGQYSIIIGDANGVDKAIQCFFMEEGYRNVIVYCMDGECRNNIGNWDIHPVDSCGRKKDFEYFTMKDIKMSQLADYGFMLWDGKSKGTLNNILNLLQHQKKVLVYFSPSKSFENIKSSENLERLIMQCDSKSIGYFEKSINLSERMRLRQAAINFDTNLKQPDATDPSVTSQ